MCVISTAFSLLTQLNCWCACCFRLRCSRLQIGMVSLWMRGYNGSARRTVVLPRMLQEISVHPLLEQSAQLEKSWTFFWSTCCLHVQHHCQITSLHITWVRISEWLYLSDYIWFLAYHEKHFNKEIIQVWSIVSVWKTVLQHHIVVTSFASAKKLHFKYCLKN